MDGLIAIGLLISGICNTAFVLSYLAEDEDYASNWAVTFCSIVSLVCFIGFGVIVF